MNEKEHAKSVIELSEATTVPDFCKVPDGNRHRFIVKQEMRTFFAGSHRFVDVDDLLRPGEQVALVLCSLNGLTHVQASRYMENKPRTVGKLVSGAYQVLSDRYDTTNSPSIPLAIFENGLLKCDHPDPCLLEVEYFPQVENSILTQLQFETALFRLRGLTNRQVAVLQKKSAFTVVNILKEVGRKLRVEFELEGNLSQVIIAFFAQAVLGLVEEGGH